MLARAPDRHGDIQAWRDFLAGLSDLPRRRTPPGIAGGARRRGLAAQHRRQFLQIFERFWPSETPPARYDHASVFQSRCARRLGFSFDDSRAVIGLEIEPGLSDGCHRRGAYRYRFERAGAQPHDRGRTLQFDRGYGFAAVDAAFDSDPSIVSHQVETISGGGASEAMRQARRCLLAVSVIAKEHGAR